MSTTAAPAIEQPIDAPITVLPVQAGDYTNVVWLDAERLVVQYHQDHIKNFSATQLGLITFTSVTIHVLDLPPHPICAGHLYSSLMPVQTPAHQIAYLSRCALSSKDGLQDYPMLYDPATATATPLRPDKFDPINAVNSVGGVQSYSFFPDLQSGVLVDTWLGDTHLHAFDPQTVTRLELDFPMVSEAQIAPDGTQIVLSYQTGRPGLHNLDKPYTIARLDPHTWEHQDLFTGYSVGAFTWAPTSDYFAVLASPQKILSSDLWIVHAETGKRVRIAQGLFAGLAWSPDGTTLAATRHINTDIMDSRTEIVLFDLSQVDLP